MPRVGFEPTIPAFERAKTVHALDRAATVIGELQGLTDYYSAGKHSFLKDSDDDVLQLYELRPSSDNLK
jgi:hypothetical protein